MERIQGTATECRTSWIPEVFAKVGNILKLRAKDGRWTDGWRVISASPPMDAQTVEANERNYLRQRKASDI
jgi:hypothetical protein